MEKYSDEPVVVLRQALAGRIPVTPQAVSSAVLLADRLEQLKQQSPIFEAVSFSPDVEAILAANLTAVMD